MGRVNEDNKTISIVWSVEDVLSVRPYLKEEEAWEVLKKVEHYHDACYGICWDTLGCMADEMYPLTLEEMLSNCDCFAKDEFCYGCRAKVHCDKPEGEEY